MEVEQNHSEWFFSWKSSEVVEKTRLRLWRTKKGCWKDWKLGKIVRRMSLFHSIQRLQTDCDEMIAESVKMMWRGKGGWVLMWARVLQLKMVWNLG
jgi:hypothetical protein